MPFFARARQGLLALGHHGVLVVDVAVLDRRVAPLEGGPVALQFEEGLEVPRPEERVREGLESERRGGAAAVVVTRPDRRLGGEVAKDPREALVLRAGLGDEVFTRGARLYLDRCKFKCAETDDFRECMEEVSGRSLEQFFWQWCTRPNIPRLKVSPVWDGAETLTVTVEQTGSPIRRPKEQRATLIGLGLNRIRRRSTLPDTPATRGMIAKVAHLVRVVEE